MVVINFSGGTVLCSFLLVLALFLSPTNSQLSVGYYGNTCPSVFETVRNTVKSAISSEARMGASLIRLLFHDCFVNGCDASILLDDGGEKDTPPNRSLRGYEVIDSIKTQLNTECGANVVSCADIVAIAARDSVVEFGGPSYSVAVGRKDSTTGFPDGVNNDLPGFSFDLEGLIRKFGEKGFSAREMVALSGAHTVGEARCATFRDRIYTETNIDPEFAMARQANCPREPNQGDDNLAPLDESTPTKFGVNYFQNLMKRRGLLHSDQVLFDGDSTDWIVSLYSEDRGAFAVDFANAMEKMGNLSPPSDTRLEVRSDCRRTN